MGISQSKEFDTSQLNSFWAVIGLSHAPLKTFVEIWYHVFLWSLFSYLIIHVTGAGIAFASLRRHRTARYAPILLLISGILTPFTAFLITSAAVAGVHRAANFHMYPLYAMFWGAGQTLVTLVFSFSRVLATL